MTKGALGEWWAGCYWGSNPLLWPFLALWFAISFPWKMSRVVASQ